MNWTIETLDRTVDKELSALPKDMQARFVTAKPKRIVISRVFIKKTQKTPRQEIKLALKRAKEIDYD